MGASTVCSERGRCLRFSCVFLWNVVTLWVKCVFSSLLIVNEGFHWWLFLSDVATQYRVKVVVFIRHPSDRRNFLWLVAAFLPCLSLFFDSGLFSPGLICCCAMSLRYVDLLSCGCAPTVCLATEFVAIFPVLRSPACSGCAGSCGFSSPIWFATFVMGSPLRGRGWCGPRSKRRFGLFLFPLWADSSRWSHPLGRDCFRSRSRSERRLSCISLGVVQGLHTHPFAPEASFSVLMPLSFGMRSPSGSSVLVGSHLSTTGGCH